MSPKQIEALRIIAEGRFLPTLVREEDGWYARWRVAGPEDNVWVDEAVRRATMTALSADAEDQRHETLHDAWLMALRSRTGLVRWDEAACAAFAAELAAWAAPLPDPSARRALVFRFAEAEGGFTLSCAAPKGLAATRALGEAVAVFGPVRGLRATGRGDLRVELSRGEAEAFLRTGARSLREAGYGVEGVEIAARITAEAELTEGDEGEGLRVKGKGLRVKGEGLRVKGEGRKDEGRKGARVRLKVRVAGEVVSAEEIRFLLEQGSSLVFFRNRWIEVDRGILREALRALEKSDGRRLSRMEAVAFAQGIGAVGRLEVEEARAHGWLRGLLNELRAKGEFSGADFRAQSERFAALAPAFAGTLRPYQARGVAWMKFLTDHGFGALLADDMGLGKTVQTIAWLCRMKNEETISDFRLTDSRLNCGNEPSQSEIENRLIENSQSSFPDRATPCLVVAPLSLIANWRHELGAFAPSLKVYVHHGDRRHLASGFRRAAQAADVVLTSYTLLVRDYGDISEVAWGALVIDEAQTIKNADTRFARAVKSLGAPKRLALTGTPVENSVSDLWSLEEFLNPGFLPDRKTFADRFVKPLALDPLSSAGKRLRRALEPFMLRRLKSESGIAAEIGEKRELREYCELAPRERAGYEAALADWRASERAQGDIFTLITRLKLVCDGMGDDAALDAAGGKLTRLLDLLDSLFAAGESALVFTQYAKVGAALKAALERKFGGRTPFLHGGLSARAREEEIAAFNAPGARAFILSLRAGGVGLNLVKATHVIHFDRWWNPAVEAQATDRAHRIGQTALVFVHLFIAAGTIEERVDAILERKRAEAGNLVTSGERFLAQMSADEFERTVALSGGNE